ncbi:hypothetical protein IRZ71_15500 [Flavobacterium sp. ANB]|uniref:hypothetical protein n=1 Tax=unclassified Flavobacterium TaxID=196869 RepID=UPI0012B89F92|nr:MULTISPECIES: hypothetical protein [unclassified Flavobacterium]MBF4517769.1 hypothetical protein [Flavobacterium sp. ANB]MTD70496.1 hypothetical protein [Flavobacterium sp. LC2016-13]
MKKALSNQEDWEQKRGGYLLVAVISILVGVYFLINLKIGSYEIKPSELEMVEGLIIKKKPEFKVSGGKNKRHWIEFKCYNNQTTFEIADYDYKCINKEEVVNEINISDTISVMVLKKDLGNIDTETSCEIHSLVDKDKEYLDINCRNNKDQKDGEVGYLICSAITVITGSVFLFKKKPKFFDDVDPRVMIWIIIILLFVVLRSILTK